MDNIDKPKYKASCDRAMKIHGCSTVEEYYEWYAREFWRPLGFPEEKIKEASEAFIALYKECVQEGL